MTLYLMVSDLRVLKAEQMLSCWPNLLFLFVSYFLFFFLHGPVVWSWGLWIDSVFKLSRPCTADSILIIIIMDTSKEIALLYVGFNLVT